MIPFADRIVLTVGFMQGEDEVLPDHERTFGSPRMRPFCFNSTVLVLKNLSIDFPRDLCASILELPKILIVLLGHVLNRSLD